MPDTLTVPPSDEDLLTPPELARELKTENGSTRTLERWRLTGKGPAFVKAGHRILYRRGDVRSWLEQQTRRHTAERR